MGVLALMVAQSPLTPEKFITATSLRFSSILSTVVGFAVGKFVGVAVVVGAPVGTSDGTILGASEV